MLNYQSLKKKKIGKIIYKYNKALMYDCFSCNLYVIADIDKTALFVMIFVQ